MVETPFVLAGQRVYVAGHRGMVGSACVRRLKREDCDILVAGRDRVDLTSQAATEAFMAEVRPTAVIVASAKVGGIMANVSLPASFLYNNLMIEANLIHAAWRSGVSKLLFLGSSCIYPREAPQPIPENALLTGPLEQTNEWYAIAKIAGIKLCQAYRRQYGCDFISAMPCSLYGPNDNFHPKDSHVIPGMMRRFHEAKLRSDPTVVCWGSGRPRREFLHVDDLAEACMFLLSSYSAEGHVNVGTGGDISVAELAEAVRRTTGFGGSIAWDTDKPDGTLLKRMDTTLINSMGWQPQISFEQGLAETYTWYQAHRDLGGTNAGRGQTAHLQGR
jgi:GDP-L-fucose synthase